MTKNKMNLKVLSLPVNVSFVRSVIGCFSLQLNPSVSEISEIKTAVSEAITNCIVHAYQNSEGLIEIESKIVDDEIHINIFDNGIGIKNINEALEPFYTTKSEEEHSGMGFTIMKNFMDDFRVESSIGKGTKIYMLKKIKTENEK